MEHDVEHLAGADPSSEETPEVLRLRGCFIRSALTLLLVAAAGYAIVASAAPQWVFDPDEAKWVQGLDFVAFECMLLGFAWLLWRPSTARRAILLAKTGLCFEIALGTGGQSYSSPGPRMLAMTFVFMVMWWAMSRLGIGATTPKL